MLLYVSKSILVRGFNRGPISGLYQSGAWDSVVIAVESAVGVCLVILDRNPAIQLLTDDGVFGNHKRRCCQEPIEVVTQLTRNVVLTTDSKE